MTSAERTSLKLIALDQEGLEIVSAHLQDAIVNVGEMTYLPRERRFAALASRFDWADALAGSKRGAKRYVRRRVGLRFEHVSAAQLSGIDLGDAKRMMSLLAIRFEPGDLPGGHVVLSFAGGAAIRLGVDCIETELRDLGAAWATPRKPSHPDSDASDS